MAVDEWSALARTGGPRLSRMFFDLDHFKSINDLHGHAAGDECLRAFAAHLRQTFPEPGALVARLGGEEFGALMRDDVLQDVVARADRFRGEFAGMVLACNPDEIRSSVSIGVVGSIRPSMPTAMPCTRPRTARCTAPRRPAAIPLWWWSRTERAWRYRNENGRLGAPVLVSRLRLRDQ